MAAMKLLLSLVPCVTSSPLKSSIDTAPTAVESDEDGEAKFLSLMRKENQKREKFVNLRESEGPASSLVMWKSLFSTWQALQHASHGSASRTKSVKRDTLGSSLPSSILAFIQKGGDDIHSLSSIMDRRIERTR